MNGKMSKLVLSTALGLALAAGSAQAETQSSSEESVGVGGGAVIGAIAGGPVGALLGAGIGAWLGDRVHDGRQLPAIEEKLHSANGDLGSTRRALDHAEHRLQVLESTLRDRDIRLAAAQLPVSAPDQGERLAQALELDILFRTGTSELANSTRDRLEELSAVVSLLGDLTVRLDGHTDPRGDAAFNQQLASQRIASVRQALIDGGVDAARIAVHAHGEKESIATVGDLDGYALERRVSITFTGTGSTVAQNQSH